jgi:predicted TPR repeat methyltransferase
MARSAADWLAEADGHYDAQRWNQAGDAFERALALDASLASAWYRLGNVREEQGRDEDAAACFEKALTLDPAHAQAWNNLGGAHQRRGRLEPAADAFRRAIRADPKLPQPYLNLGRLHVLRGEHALAAECFAAGLAQHPGDASFAHLVAAARGQNTARAPEGYVTQLFDGIAPQFEHHLVHDLGYRVPEALAALALPALRAALAQGAANAAVRAIDLGCGTGLVGAALAQDGAGGPAGGVELIGVDLSPRMLEIAAARGVYARLEQGEIVAALGRVAPGSIHAVLAADVFIYVGDLAEVFAAVGRALAPRGVFAFSVEGLEDGDYRLLPSGRYAQSPAYLRGLAARSGLAERSLERAPIRRDGEGFAQGWLALFERTGER